MLARLPYREDRRSYNQRDKWESGFESKVRQFQNGSLTGGDRPA